MRRYIAAIVTMLVVLLPSSVLSDSKSDRAKAFNMLYTAYQKYYTGNEEEGRKGVEDALKTDPNLAYGNIVRGEFAMKEQDWPNAQKYYEKGLKLLKQPDQPLSPDPKIGITVKEVEGDTRCFLGYVYIKQAQRANRSGNIPEEQKYLELSENSLRYGLKLSPGKEARELAEGLLKKFR
jgi:tetratricopeptide (TPR) repeat protein